MVRTSDVMVVQEDAIRNLNLALKSWEPAIKLHIDEPPPWDGGWAPLTNNGEIAERIADWMFSRGHKLGSTDITWLAELSEQVIPAEEEDIYSWLNDTPLPTPPPVVVTLDAINAAVVAYFKSHDLCDCDTCVRGLQHHVNRYLRTHPDIISKVLVEQAIERSSL
jgi:hypothetical protein